MITITSTFYDERIALASKLVMDHYNDKAFLKQIKAVKSFNHTHDQGYNITDKLIYAEIEITIKPYKTLSPWSKVIGHARGNTIYVNTRKLDLPLEDRVANIMHEALHLLGYSHKGNRVTEYNKNTVPYRVSKIFSEYITNLQKEGL